ncbi:putative extracellular conserved serine-rich protein [Botrytis fragariae]|uniref:Putative extracellular conserved serine-rich protein n=1 Tax=Botrytis fragariae TaxID=1964551 RepID=A0A8H6B1M4_9HELO|nr:putative extracellular conserved serine-rich protein [Botrytis fragariae]KAF5877483.1 putative extracellular conserved serine-rich protein [Botrytis fragariae]
MARYALAFTALFAIAQAINITSPSTNGEWDLSDGAQTITWTSVTTDPQTVDIYLVHMASNPPLSDVLFTNVDITKGSESVSGLQLPTGGNYQINFVSPGKAEQILAQSQQFTVNGVASSASSTLAGYTGASSTSSSASSTSSSSSSSSATSSTSSASTSGTSSLTSSSGSASASSTTSTGTSTFTSTGSSTTVTGTTTSTGTGLVTSASAASQTSSGASSSSSSSSSASASGNGAAATGIPMVGLLAGAVALFL